MPDLGLDAAQGRRGRVVAGAERFRQGPGFHAIFVGDFSAEATTGMGFDVALDLVGGSYVGATIPAMALQGRLMVLATVGGKTAELPLGLLLSKRLTVKGTVLRARSLEEKIAATKRFAEEVLPPFASGYLKVPVERSAWPLKTVTRSTKFRSFRVDARWVLPNPCRNVIV